MTWLSCVTLVCLAIYFFIEANKARKEGHSYSYVFFTVLAIFDIAQVMAEIILLIRRV